eukprot:242122_1
MPTMLLIALSLLTSPIRCQHVVTADDSYCLAIDTNSGSTANNPQAFWCNISSSSSCINWGLEEHFNRQTQDIYHGKLFVNGIGANAINQATYLSQRMYVNGTSVIIADTITNHNDEFEIDRTQNTLSDSNCALGMSATQMSFLLENAAAINGYDARFDCSNNPGSVAINIAYRDELYYVFQGNVIASCELGQDQECDVNAVPNQGIQQDDPSSDDFEAKFIDYWRDGSIVPFSNTCASSNLPDYARTNHKKCTEKYVEFQGNEDTRTLVMIQSQLQHSTVFDSEEVPP